MSRQIGSSTRPPDRFCYVIYLKTLEEGYLRRLQSQVNQIQLPDGGAHE